MIGSAANESGEITTLVGIDDERATLLGPPRPRIRESQADRVADAIVEHCVLGVFQPGQRLKENELARLFDVSRVPVREALMELASQGVVYYTPRRSARLMHVDALKLRKVLEVRERLETLALQTALQMIRSEPAALSPLHDAINAMAEASRSNDALGAAKADVAFHRALCLASGNEVLVNAWDAVSRQFLIMLAIENRVRQTRFPHVEIHRSLLNRLVEADYAEAERALSEHILREWLIGER
jgi:DNA-binding GntR family transcriptional regulator